MPAINKEIKNKNSMLKMQVTAEQRVFVVKTYSKTSRYLEVKEAIHRRFSERPCNKYDYMDKRDEIQKKRNKSKQSKHQ